MFNLKKEQLKKLGAFTTVKETKQQPILWTKTFKVISRKKNEIDSFLRKLKKRHETIRVIFAGAGSSAYVGDTVIPYLKGKINEKNWVLLSIPTTEIVSNPYEYLKKDIPTLLVSFARSGNSPESVATVNLGKKIVNHFYQITITCASDGKLAQQSIGDNNNLLLLMPEDSNDKAFAMTGSYTCMTLAALLIFDPTSMEEKEKIIMAVSSMGEEIVMKEDEIQKIVNLDFKRIIYLGSGSLGGMAREASLKLLELTAGKIATVFDSSLGFRHGPKSFVNDEALVFVFTSNNEYTRNYDIDMLNELNDDKMAKYVCGLTILGKKDFSGDKFVFNKNHVKVADAYMALPFVMFAQILAVMTAIKIGNKADTPSPTRTVNRVVKGVKIHLYS